METWLALARGPFFWAALTFMVLGLLRHVAVSLSDVKRITRRAGDKRIPHRRIAKATLAWLFPFSKFGHRTMIGIASFVFHVAIIVVPVFLAGHIALWRASIGISWPAISSGFADVLTIVAVAAAFALVLQRAIAKDKRAMSRFQDYFLPLFVALPFAAGFLVVHPAWNPFPYDATLLIHVMSANVLMILIPTTKLNHAVFMPESHLLSEVAWHWPPDAGRTVGRVLGREGEPV